MSAPIGNFGIAIFSYDKVAAIYDKSCAINAAPLERVGLAVSMDKASYNSSLAGVFQYPGDWDMNFVKMLVYTSDVSIGTGDSDLIASQATVIPDSDVLDDGTQVTGQQIIRIPEEWAGTTQEVNFIYQFSHNKSGLIETDYVVIPVRVTVKDFEPDTPLGRLELISVEDDQANDVSLGICWDNLPQTITFTFQFNDPNPDSYLFIPLIKSENGDWQEYNAWTNANMPQLTNDLVISVDEEFTGGTAQLVVDPVKLLLGDYCIGAIAKLGSLVAPVPCTVTIDVSLDVVFNMWTPLGFTTDLDYGVTVPAGHTIQRIQVSIALVAQNPGFVQPAGTYLQIVEENTLSVSGSSAFNDNEQGSRPDGGTYTFQVEVLVRITNDTTDQICSYNGFYHRVVINTPSEGDSLPNYVENWSEVINGITINDQGKIN